MNTVEKFINKFKYLNPSAAEDLFLYGDCYYFAIILKERFPEAIIKYMVIKNHFIADIDGRLYDIRGDITDIINEDYIIEWSDMELYDELVYQRIIRDCINF